MDLNFDLIEKRVNRVIFSLSRYYQHPSGDLIADPDMCIRLDRKEKTVEALSLSMITRMKRDEAKEILLTMGANVTGSVSAKTDYVIVGEKTGSKLQKAMELEIKILSETEFLEMLSGM